MKRHLFRPVCTVNKRIKIRKLMQMLFIDLLLRCYCLTRSLVFLYLSSANTLFINLLEVVMREKLTFTILLFCTLLLIALPYGSLNITYI